MDQDNHSDEFFGGHHGGGPPSENIMALYDEFPQEFNNSAEEPVDNDNIGKFTRYENLKNSSKIIWESFSLEFFAKLLKAFSYTFILSRSIYQKYRQCESL